MLQTPYAVRTCIAVNKSLRRCRGFSAGNSAVPLKVLFFGTDDFSLPTLKALQNDMSPSIAADAAADHRSGRGCVGHLEVCHLRMQHLVSSVQRHAEAHGLHTHPWPPDLQQGQFDVGVVASFGKLLPKRIIDSFPRGVLNVHASLLPRWRGASPIVHAIMNGDRETGISIMEIKPHHFDIGSVLVQRTYPIHCDISRKELSEALSHLGANLMLEVLQNLESYSEHKVQQDNEAATYAPVVDSSMFRLHWNEMSQQQVWNRYRALADYGKLQSVWAETGEVVRFDVMLHPSELLPLNLDEKYRDSGAPGQTVHLKNKLGHFLCIKCKDGWVSFQKFYYGKRKVMDALDFYNGLVSKHKGSKRLCFV